MKIGLRPRRGAQSPVSSAQVVLDAEGSGLECVTVADDLRLPDVGIGFPNSGCPSLGAIAVATDVASVVDAHQAAGGSGDVSAALLLADLAGPRSIDVARAMLVDRADLDDALEAGVPDEGRLFDDDVEARWIDVTEQSRPSDAIAQLSGLGVRRIELMSTSRGPHLAIRQWRECNGVVETPGESRQPLVEQGPRPRPVAAPAPFDVEADGAVSAAARPRPAVVTGEPARVHAPAAALEPTSSPVTVPPVPVSTGSITGDAEVVDLVAADRSSSATTPLNVGLP